MFSDFQGWWQVLGVVIVFAVVQTIDGTLITPRIIGSRIGLHPVLVIITLLTMASWFGLWGVLAALPLMALSKVLGIAMFDYYVHSKFYRS